MTEGPKTKVTDYLDGFQYVDEELEFFPHAEGYVKVTTRPNGAQAFNYVYNYTDHLGNIRVRYTLDPSTDELTILEEDHYYPFGLKHNGYNAHNYVFMSLDGGPVELIPTNPNVLDSYKYKYNGKEWQSELGLNMYAMDMRQYDPAIGRWVVQDPIVHFDYSTYSAFDNNPVFWADPSGADSSTDIWGRNRFDKYGMYVPPYMRGAKSNSYEDCDDCSVCPEKCNDSNRGGGKSQSGQTNSGGGGCPDGDCKNWIIGIYGAGGEGSGDNDELKKLVEEKGGIMFEFYEWSKIKKYIIDAWNNGNGASIEIYGYSRGGNTAVRIANAMPDVLFKKMVLFDPHILQDNQMFVLTNGSNVRELHNYYQNNQRTWGQLLPFEDNPYWGHPIKAQYSPLYSPREGINNYNLTGSNYPVNHNNIIWYVTQRLKVQF